jgi:hypothetical protein
MGKTPFDEARDNARQFAVGLVKSLMYIHAAEEMQRQEQETTALAQTLKTQIDALKVSGSADHVGKP